MSDPFGFFIPLWDWESWPFFGAPHHYPPPVSANERGFTSGTGTLEAVIVPKIAATFVGGGELSMQLDFQLQHSTPHPRSTGMLVDSGHSTPGMAKGHGTLHAAAVATAWELPFGTPPDTVRKTHIFENLPTTWQSTATKIVWIGVDGSYWNLAGNYEGREGLRLAPHMAGFMHAPFKSLFSEGPYQIGAHYERSDYGKREFKFGVMVNARFGPDESSWKYRMLEERWWRSWAPDKLGYLCAYTRTHGWRFLRCQLGQAPDTPIELDPVAYDNNFMQWDMVAVAAQPFWQKKWPAESWTNHHSTSTTAETIEFLLERVVNPFTFNLLTGLPDSHKLLPGRDMGQKTFNVWNGGDYPQWPKFLVSAPGQCWIQDGPGGNMLQLPLMTDASQGPILVDTDPVARTITSPADPSDPLLFSQLNNTGLLEILLQPLLGRPASTLWSQFKQFFTTPCPPASTIGNQPSPIKVYHSDPNGAVTCFMPQQFDKAYG